MSVRSPTTRHLFHSPAGFEWGYGGSGPADLARCMLLDHYGVAPGRRGSTYPPADGELPVSYQNFKWQLIAHLPKDAAWTITAAQIRRWARTQR